MMNQYMPFFSVKSARRVAYLLLFHTGLSHLNCLLDAFFIFIC